jgi:hypothetical protein
MSAAMRLARQQQRQRVRTQRQGQRHQAQQQQRKGWVPEQRQRQHQQQQEDQEWRERPRPFAGRRKTSAPFLRPALWPTLQLHKLPGACQHRSWLRPRPAKARAAPAPAPALLQPAGPTAASNPPNPRGHYAQLPSSCQVASSTLPCPSCLQPQPGMHPAAHCYSTPRHSDACPRKAPARRPTRPPPVPVPCPPSLVLQPPCRRAWAPPPPRCPPPHPGGSCWPAPGAGPPARVPARPASWRHPRRRP